VRLLGERPAKGRVISVAALSLIAVLSVSCSATPPAAAIPPATATATAQATADPPGNVAHTFTVTGAHPVSPNGSQDTNATTPAAACDNVKFTADTALGAELVDGFSFTNFPVASSLLAHFLKGKGTEIDYPVGSQISKKALASSGFRAVNEKVQGEILLQLRAGHARVQLSAAQLPTVEFGSKASDLYWGFRGTQGLAVTGNGSRENGSYVGTLTYVIRDSYGFPADDTLDGFGAPMRYLQTACGAPQHAGGAHWFPDSITVTVPFHQTA
jgi:hypothetical protein